MSANQLLSPNASLNPSLPENLPILYTAHGGARIQLVRGPKGLSKDVVLSWKYLQQGGRNQLDMGAYCDLSVMTLGLWYRGVPVQKAADGSLDVDALSFVFGFGSRDLKMGYSYDVALNRLGALGSAGSHEISLKYMWDVARRRDHVHLLPLRGILSSHSSETSVQKSNLIDLRFQGHPKGGLDGSHDVLGQGPYFLPCATVMHKHKGLLVMHPMGLSTVPFPARLFNEPARSQFDVAGG